MQLRIVQSSDICIIRCWHLKKVMKLSLQQHLQLYLSLIPSWTIPVYIDQRWIHGIGSKRTESAITENTKAVMVVHNLGHQKDEKKIQGIEANSC